MTELEEVLRCSVRSPLGRTPGHHLSPIVKLAYGGQPEHKTVLLSASSSVCLLSSSTGKSEHRLDNFPSPPLLFPLTQGVRGNLVTSRSFIPGTALLYVISSIAGNTHPFLIRTKKLEYLQKNMDR